MPKRVVVGVVTRDKADKTRRVEVPRLVRHKKYGKIIHQRTVCYAHDENNASAAGDTVEIISLPWRNYAAHLMDNFNFTLPANLDILIEDELNHPSPCVRR